MKTMATARSLTAFAASCAALTTWALTLDVAEFGAKPDGKATPFQ